MIKKYLKTTLIASIIGVIIAFGIPAFLSYKINAESKRYIVELEQFNLLQDTLSLCTGLYQGNPTIETKKECESILTKIYKVRANQLNNYPYSDFYTKYISQDK